MVKVHMLCLHDALATFFWSTLSFWALLKIISLYTTFVLSFLLTPKGYFSAASLCLFFILALGYVVISSIHKHICGWVGVSVYIYVQYVCRFGRGNISITKGS